MIINVSKKPIKYIHIGYIDFSNCDREIELESNIVSKDTEKPNLHGIGKCEIFVGSDEGPVPHVHIVSNDANWGTCICLHEAYYFPHGDNPLTRGVLNSKQSKEFDKWMSRQSAKSKGISNYLHCSKTWLSQYGDVYNYIYSKNHTNFTIKPDYTRMCGDFNENLR